ncbi:MAG: hypothetical protein KF799_16240 [Bdellovibrionales bacterium]|nr:hypothetical protein [Bdellovibrionales bacterium]
MNLERFLNYVTHHSESIIQWLFLGILVLAGTLIARSLFRKDEVSSSSSSSSAGATAGAGASPELQAVLDKIMAQTAKLEGVSLKDVGPAGVAEVDAQVQSLKKDLASREEEIAQLKAAGPSKAGEDATALSTRIKELEAKLAEYEILEDDIADLSLYKEENTRLRAELEKVKGGAVAAPAAATPDAAPAVVAEVPTPEPQTGEAIVAEFAQAVSSEPAAQPESVAAEALTIPDTGNPMADFESTVKLERELSGTAEPDPAVATAAEPAPAASPSPAPTPTPAPSPEAQAAFAAAPTTPPASAAPEAAAATEADDLFAEFASEAAPEAEGSSTLDTDKMMEEMAALVGMEPSSGNALEESIDIEKMAMEAKKS